MQRIDLEFLSVENYEQKGVFWYRTYQLRDVVGGGGGKEAENIPTIYSLLMTNDFFLPSELDCSLSQ